MREVANQWWYYSVELSPGLIARGIDYDHDIPLLPRLELWATGTYSWGSAAGRMFQTLDTEVTSHAFMIGGRVRYPLRGYLSATARLDLGTARAAVSGYDIRLVLTGPTDNLSTELLAPSNPELTRADVASLLLTGRTLDKVSTEGRAIVGERMASYLGSSLADLAELGLGAALPFDVVTVEPALIAGEADPGARFTLGARFNDSFNSLDLRVSRAFALGRRSSLTAIAEVFNVFDVTNVLGVSKSNYSGYANVLVRDSDDPADPGFLRSSSFGRPLTTAGGVFGSGGPRALQLGLRFAF